MHTYQTFTNDVSKPVDGRVTTTRAVVTVGMLSVLYGIALAVAERIDAVDTVARLISLLVGVSVVPLVASPIEWAVHRFVYHDRVVAPLGAINTVHLAHHHAYFPTWRYVTRGPSRRLPVRNGHVDVATSPTRNALIRLSHFVWYMSFGLVVIWLPAVLVTGNSWYLAGTVVGSAVVSNLFVVVHDTIHRPGSHRIIEAQPWYGFLDRHHFIHHVDLGSNLNFLLPLADWLFGTLRTEMTEDEIDRHGTLDEAKASPAGEGERARRTPVLGVGN